MFTRKMFLALAVFAFAFMAVAQAAESVITTKLVAKNPDGTTVARHGWDLTSGTYNWRSGYPSNEATLVSGDYKGCVWRIVRAWGTTSIWMTQWEDNQAVTFNLPQPQEGYIHSYNVNLNKFCNRIKFTYGSGITWKVNETVFGRSGQALNASTLKSNSSNFATTGDTSGRFSFPMHDDSEATAARYSLYIIYSDGVVDEINAASFFGGYGDYTLPFGAAAKSASDKRVDSRALKTAVSKNVKTLGKIEVKEVGKKAKK